MSSPSVAGHAPALRACWHPVAQSTDLGAGTPLAADLLGEALVLWRDGDGAPHAFLDLCIHRGTALSLGTVEGDEIVCAYHGWRYRTDGACTRIPQLTDATKVPAKARATAFTCRERYGFVWVVLGEPRFDLPEVPELEDPAWATVFCGPYTWACDASRQVENFTDFGHFPFVHPGLLGDPERPVVPGHTVETQGHVLHYDIVRPEATANEDSPVFGNEVVVAPERRSRYELHLPYTIVLRLGWGGQAGMVYFFACRPEGPERTTGFLAIARNYNLDQPDSVLQEFEDVIFEQDRRIVESQRPERVPFDLADELHLTFDAVAVAYRRAMRANGLSL